MRSNFSVSAAFFFYFCLSIGFFGLRFPLTHWLLGVGSDPKSSVWFLEWWPWAVVHGRSPFWSHAVFAPAGYSMAWATSLGTASLLALPITLSAGPVAAFNVLTLAAPALAGASCFVLARAVTKDQTVSAVAGFLFAFSGYEDGQLLGHLNLDLTFLLPIVVLLVIRRLSGELRRGRFIGLLALALFMQFGLSSELFATMVAFGLGALSVAILLGGNDAAVRRLALVDCAIALALATILITPMLVSMWRGSGDMPDFVNSPITYSDDLLNLVVPTDAERFAPPLTRYVSSRFTGNDSEQDLYLGIPLLLIVVLFAFERGHMRGRLSFSVGFVGLVVASLGPRLQVGGIRTSVWLPWAVLTHLPLLRGALPCRIGLFVSLAACLAAAVWMANPAVSKNRVRRILRVALGCLACAFLVPGAARLAWSKAGRQCFFDRDVQQGPALQGKTVLLLPFGSGDSMLWQAEADMRFSQAGGLLSFVPNSLGRDPLVLPLLGNNSEPNFAPDLNRFARRHGVTTVIAGPGTSVALVSALEATNWPKQQVCADFTTFTRPNDLPPD